MATERSVKVRLTAEARSLKEELKASALAAEELKTATGETKRELGDLQTRADKAGISLLKLAADGKLAGEGLKAADKQLTELNRDLGKLGGTHTTGAAASMANLEAEITRTKTRMQELAQEFKTTGSAASLAGFKQAEKDLKALESLAKDLRRVFDAAGSGSSNQGFLRRLIGTLSPSNLKQLAGEAGNSLSKALGDALTGSAGIWGYAIPGLVVAAPAAGAILGAGILTGIGLAGIGAGIAGQISDRDVQTAIAKLGKDVGAGFKDATASFKQPLIDGLGIIAGEFDKLAPELKKTFSDLAPMVTVVANGVAGFVDKLAPGLERAAAASKPLVTDLSIWLPKLGSELGGFFSAVGEHSQEAQQGLHMLTGSIDILIGQLTLVTNLGSSAFDWAVPPETKMFFDKLASGGQFNGMIKSLGDTSQAASETEAKFSQLQQQIGKTTITADTLAGQMADKVFSSMMNLDQANLSVASSLVHVSDALKKNKRDLSLHTDAGIADRQAILSAVSANMQQYDSLIQAGVSAEDAAAAYDQNTAALERQLRKAGMTKQEIDGLIGKYKQVPDKVNTNIAMQGLTDAINNLADLIAGLNGINNRHVQTYVDQYVRVHQGGSGPSANKPIPYAMGGVAIPAMNGLAYGAGIYPASNPPLIKFAEPQTRGETLIPNYGIPAQRGLALADYAASHYGGRVMAGPANITLTIAASGGRGIDAAMASWFQSAVRGGAIQLYANGQPVTVRSGR